MADRFDLELLAPDLDALEWDATNPAGDEKAYDGPAVALIPFESDLFPENDEVEVL